MLINTWWMDLFWNHRPVDTFKSDRHPRLQLHKQDGHAILVSCCLWSPITFYSLPISPLFVETCSVLNSPFLCSFLDFRNNLIVHLLHIRCPKGRILCILKLAGLLFNMNVIHPASYGNGRFSGNVYTFCKHE